MPTWGVILIIVGISLIGETAVLIDYLINRKN